jgi:hypothetical protein
MRERSQPGRVKPLEPFFGTTFLPQKGANMVHTMATTSFDQLCEKLTPVQNPSCLLLLFQIPTSFDLHSCLSEMLLGGCYYSVCFSFLLHLLLFIFCSLIYENRDNFIDLISVFMLL